MGMPICENIFVSSAGTFAMISLIFIFYNVGAISVNTKQPKDLIPE